MSGQPQEAALLGPSKPRRVFKVARKASPLSKEESAREGQIIRTALDHLGVAAARTFLNTSDPVLGGRPIQLAMASREGAAAVNRAIVELRTYTA